jgi:hypothetical protein
MPLDALDVPRYNSSRRIECRRCRPSVHSNFDPGGTWCGSCRLTIFFNSPLTISGTSELTFLWSPHLPNLRPLWLVLLRVQLRSRPLLQRQLHYAAWCDETMTLLNLK